MELLLSNKILPREFLFVKKNNFGILFCVGMLGNWEQQEIVAIGSLLYAFLSLSTS